MVKHQKVSKYYENDCSLKINPKIEDNIPKRRDYNRINIFFVKINEIKKKNVRFISLDLKFTTKDVFEDELLLFECKGMSPNHSYFDNDIKKNSSINFSINNLKLLD